MLSYDMFIAPKFHYFNLVLLTFLLVVIDLGVAVVEHLSAFFDLAL